MLAAVVKNEVSSFPPTRNNREERQQIPKSFYSIRLRHIPYQLVRIGYRLYRELGWHNSKGKKSWLLVEQDS